MVLIADSILKIEPAKRLFGVRWLDAALFFTTNNALLKWKNYGI